MVAVRVVHVNGHPRSRAERFRARHTVWQWLTVFEGWTIVGRRKGTYRDPVTGAVPDLWVNSSLFMIVEGLPVTRQTLWAELPQLGLQAALLYNVCLWLLLTDEDPVRVSLDRHQYLNEKQTKVKASSLRRSKELLDHLRPLLGAVPLVALKPARISDAYNRLLTSLSKRTVRHCHWQLHGALELAVNWGQVPANVAGRVTPPEPDDFEGRALTQTEVGQLLVAVEGTEYEALVWLALDTGARQGELLALQNDDVDLERGLIHIRRSVRRITGQGMVYSSPKTKLSKRTVEIAPATVAVLRAFRLSQKERRLRAGDLWDTSADLFFANDLGGPLDGVGVTKGFQKLVANAGLGELRFHDLRHSSATRLLAAGARMDEVRARMGHSSIMTTVNTYAHHTANGASVAEKMQAILTQPDKNSDGWLANG